MLKKISKEQTEDMWLDWYYNMLYARKFEQYVASLYEEKRIRGYCHLYIGEEAVAVGSLAVLDPKLDKVITSYRAHVHAVLRSHKPLAVLAELLGMSEGVSGGKGGSMHMFAIEQNFYGGHGIVGAQVSIGTGIAFSQKYNQSNGVTLVYLGDGAVNQGQVYESWNMASLWKLPVLYIIENNKYGLGTSVERELANYKELYKRGEPLGIPGHQVDGMKVKDVYDVVSDLVSKIKKGSGPQILEAKTYRYRGHSMSDPAQYRTREEVQNVRQHHDAIKLFHQYLLNHHVSEDKLKQIDDKVAKQMSELREGVNTLTPNTVDTLYAHVYNMEENNGR